MVSEEKSNNKINNVSSTSLMVNNKKENTNQQSEQLNESSSSSTLSSSGCSGTGGDANLNQFSNLSLNNHLSSPERVLIGMSQIAGSYLDSNFENVSTSSHNIGGESLRPIKNNINNNLVNNMNNNDETFSGLQYGPQRHASYSIDSSSSLSTKRFDLNCNHLSNNQDGKNSDSRSGESSNYSDPVLLNSLNTSTKALESFSRDSARDGYEELKCTLSQQNCSTQVLSNEEGRLEIAEDDDEEDDTSVVPMDTTESTESATNNEDLITTFTENISNCSNSQVVQLKISDIKSDLAEFQEFVLIFLYLNNITEPKVIFNENQFILNFQTDYDILAIKNASIGEDNKIYYYSLELNFKHEIIPDQSLFKVKPKSIELRLSKKRQIIWGSIKEVCSATATDTNADLNLPSSPIKKTFATNTWTPCANPSSNSSAMSLPSMENYLSSPSTITKNNQMALVKYEDNSNDESETENEKGRWYGMTGLQNIGNTCFLNSVLQVLANTDPLKDYFLSREFLNDINVLNPLGSKGLMAKAFSHFLTQLWRGKQSSFYPYKLKTLLSEKVQTFAGYNQHDAQEFMSFFLDSIHEDLNRIENRSKVINSPDDEENDTLFDSNDFLTASSNPELAVKINNRLQEISEKMWSQYKLFSNSIVTDLFCGQFKSILTCPDCSKKSIIFDPFLYVPLPIPPPKLSIHLFYFARDEETGFCQGVSRFRMKLSHKATVNDLLERFFQYRDLPNRNVHLIQPQDDNIPPKFLTSTWSLSDCLGTFNNSFSNRPLLLFELPKEKSDNDVELCVIQRELSPSPDDIPCHQIGLPFVVSLKKSRLSFSYLAAVLCSYARHSIITFQNFMPFRPPTRRFNVQSFTLRQLAKRDLFNSSSNEGPSSLNSLQSWSDQMPHLVYYKTNRQTDRDNVVAPFLLHKNPFNISTQLLYFDEEITPPVIVRDQEREKIRRKKIKKETNESNDDDEENEENIDDENKIKENGRGHPDEDEEEEEDDEEDEDSRERENLIYNNDDFMELTPETYFIGMDWIPRRHYVRFTDAVEVSLADHPLENSECIPDEDITLEDCIRNFSEPEILGPQNCWKCPNCKVLREALKQLSFWRLPSILVIQLKRFRLNGSVYNNEKISQFIKYPLNGLDLRQCYLNNGNEIKFIDDKGQQIEPIYDLYGVVNHLGSPYFGHYTAYARSSDGELGWRSFDDQSVENIDENCVVSSKAYLLFYKLRLSKKTTNTDDSF